MKALGRILAYAAVTFLISLNSGRCAPPGPGASPNRILNAWLFSDTNWLSSSGHAPMAFTNLVNSPGGAGNTLELDSTNSAFLQYHMVEANDRTNLIVESGSLSFWFRPHWTSADQGGTGP